MQALLVGYHIILIRSLALEVWEPLFSGHDHAIHDLQANAMDDTFFEYNHRGEYRHDRGESRPVAVKQLFSKHYKAIRKEVGFT